MPRRPGPPFRASEPPQNKVKFARDPAKFRHTLLTASLNGGLEPKSQKEKQAMRTSLVGPRRERNARAAASAAAAAAAAAPTRGRRGESQRAMAAAADEAEEHPEPSYAAKLALAARDNRASSAWAVMTRYADDLAAQEDVMRREMRRRNQETQRQTLNRQLEELRLREEKEKEELRREAEVGSNPE